VQGGGVATVVKHLLSLANFGFIFSRITQNFSVIDLIAKFSIKSIDHEILIYYLINR